MSQPVQRLECDPVEQQLRQDFLDHLYLKSDRSNPEHPHHATYTGLFMEFAAEVEGTK